MSDLKEAVDLVYEAVKDLDTGERQRVLRCVGTLLDDTESFVQAITGQVAPAKQPAPARHVDGRSREAKAPSPKASGARQSAQSDDRKGRPYEKNRLGFNRVLSILLQHPTGIRATELKRLAGVTEQEWTAAKRAAETQGLAKISGHGAGATRTPCRRVSE